MEFKEFKKYVKEKFYKMRKNIFIADITYQLPNGKEKKIRSYFKFRKKTLLIILSNKPILQDEFFRIIITDNRKSNCCLLLFFFLRNDIWQSKIRGISNSGCCWNLSGKEVLKIADFYNRLLRCQLTSLEDKSIITMNFNNFQKYSCSLMLLSLIKYKQTWYERQGFEAVYPDRIQKFLKLKARDVEQFLIILCGYKKNKITKRLSYLLRKLKLMEDIFLFVDKLRKLFLRNNKNIILIDTLRFINKKKFPDVFLRYGIGKIIFELFEMGIYHIKYY